MKRFVLITILTLLSSCSHSPPPIEPAKPPEKVIDWKECKDADVCVLVPAECGQPRAINLNAVEAYTRYITGVANLLMCNGFVAREWDSGITGKCNHGSCVAVKTKIKTSIDKLPKDLSKKVHQLYLEGMESKKSADWMTCLIRLQTVHTFVEKFKDSESLFIVCKRMLMSGAKPEGD